MLLGLISALVLSAAPPAKVTLVFGGDVIPHDPVKQAAQAHARKAPKDELEDTANHGGWDQVFGALGPVFKRADASFVNLETPVMATPGRGKGEFFFNAPPTLLEGLKGAGVSVATFANNHCLDQGPQGIVETRQHLAEAGLLTAGAAESKRAAYEPLVLKRHGLRIGVLAMTRWSNMHLNPKDGAKPWVPVVLYPKDVELVGITEAQFLTAVREVAKSVDVLVVTAHWGTEYHPEPLKEDRDFAQALLDAGALVVVGHHPHVLQPVEHLVRKDGTPGVVAYSLGNLVSNQDLGEPESPTRDGMLLEVEVTKTIDDPARVAKVTLVPTYTENRARPGKVRNVQAVLLEDEVAAQAERLEELAARTDKAGAAERKALTARHDIATARVSRIRALDKRPTDEPGPKLTAGRPGPTPTPTRSAALSRE
jgi:poly-gamma-glutamate synthesis protein (capsule biosynthesis protein)